MIGIGLIFRAVQWRDSAGWRQTNSQLARQRAIAEQVNRCLLAVALYRPPPCSCGSISLTHGHDLNPLTAVSLCNQSSAYFGLANLHAKRQSSKPARRSESSPDLSPSPSVASLRPPRIPFRPNRSFPTGIGQVTAASLATRRRSTTFADNICGHRGSLFILWVLRLLKDRRAAGRQIAFASAGKRSRGKCWTCLARPRRLGVRKAASDAGGEG